MLRFSLLLIAITALGCAAQIGTIRKVDTPETWTLALDGDDSLSLRKTIFEQADAFCHEKKKYLMPDKKNYSATFYQLYFRCLPSGDPELINIEGFDQEMRYRKKLGGYGEVKY
nr:hypothetical protein [Desulfobulbaceae bacterium]